MNDFLPEEVFMRLAIEKAACGVSKGQWPYGACLVKNGRVLSCVHNVTRANMDPTGHAETHAIREACSKLRSVDLTGCEIYATCEPCPMCFTACHKVGLSAIVFGAGLEDSPGDGGGGKVVTSYEMKDLLDSKIQLVGGFLGDEVLQLYRS